MKSPIYEIKKSSQTHQSSPSWIVAFFPFVEPRVGYSDKDGKTAKAATRPPIIVMNDAISVAVSRPKNSFMKSASITLKSGELNYKERVRPGDYVGIWMFEWSEDADRVFKKIQAGQAANDFMSGLKFFGRVTRPSEAVSTNGNGAPDKTTTITATMFKEYGSSVYIHPLADINTSTGIDAPNSQTFIAQFGKVLFEKYLKEGGVFKSPGDVIKILTQIFLGNGPDSDFRNKTRDAIGQDMTFSEPIAVPASVSRIFGQSGIRPMVDLTHYYIGVEQYTPGRVSAESAGSGAKMYPSNTTLEGTFRTYPERPLKGNIFLDIAPWSNQGVLDIMNSFLNPVCNELFSCMRFDDRGGIRPTVVARQLPFTTNLLAAMGGKQIGRVSDLISKVNTKSAKKISPSLLLSTTEFANLPRWRVDPSRIKSSNMGTDDDRRVNFVQVFGTSTASAFTQVQIDQPGESAGINPQQNNQILQFALDNFIQDEQDIRRNGLRSVIMQTPFDIITLDDGGAGASLNLLAPYWAALQADFLFNSHLHEQGRVSMSGVTEPICEGDNFEVDGVLYHIDGIEHVARMVGSKKEFATVLTLSRGTLAASLERSGLPVYPCQNETYADGPFGQTDRQYTLHTNRDAQGQNLSVKQLSDGESE